MAYYRAAAGEHPSWAEYRAAMVADRRVLMTMRVERVYGAKDPLSAPVARAGG